MAHWIKRHKDKARLGWENFREYCRLKADPRVADVLTLWEDMTDGEGNRIDSHLVKILPVFCSDTLETLTARYEREFPQECADFIAQVRADFAAMRDRGWSRQRSMRLAMMVPETLYRCIEYLDPAFFAAGNVRKNMRRLRALLPCAAAGVL